MHAKVPLIVGNAFGLSKHLPMPQALWSPLSGEVKDHFMRRDGLEFAFDR